MVLSSYLSTLYYAVLAIRNSLIFTVVIGGVAFYLHESKRPRRSRVIEPASCMFLNQKTAIISQFEQAGIH